MESDVSDRSQAVLRNAVATLGIGGAEVGSLLKRADQTSK